MAVTVFAAVFIAIITGALLLEIRVWVRGTRMISRRQKTYRVTAALFMDAVLLMIIFGPTVHAHKDPLFELAYWGVAILLSCMLMIVALLDVRAGLMVYRQTRRDTMTGLFSNKRRDQ